jgi:hypothetical protein
MRYPASLLHTVLRSFFGCGVVCGLGLRVKESREPNWVLCIDPGLAIDCQGYPIELCTSVELDLSPDACACDRPPEQVCIAVRRITSDEAPQNACSCDVDAPQFDCRRIRDHVVVKAFSSDELDALNGTICRRAPENRGTSEGSREDYDDGSGETRWSDALCDSMTACPSCTCGKCWVLLGCVALREDEGITGKPDMSDRRWVKPVEALCATVVDRIEELEVTVAKLIQPPTTRSAQTTPPAPALEALPTAAPSSPQGPPSP